jgi:hypothetical protein
MPVAQMFTTVWLEEALSDAAEESASIEVCPCTLPWVWFDPLQDPYRCTGLMCESRYERALT